MNEMRSMTYSHRCLRTIITLTAFMACLSVAEAQTRCSSDLESELSCSELGLSMNDIQSLGSHNSYKLAIPEAELAMIREVNPRSALTLDYSHIGIREQLERGLRQIELDIVYDPEGGRYADPLLPRLAAQQGNGTTFDASGLDAPGFKVLHAQDIDVRSSCVTWIACLQEIRHWSDANPDHIPLLIMFNAKEGGNSYPGTIEALEFTEEAYADLEEEILSVFEENRIITPDKLRGSYSSLRQAVLAQGWPSLEESRGKVFFALDEGRRKVEIYLGGSASAEGKLIFPNSVSEEADHAAYFTLNDPIAQRDQIRQAVSKGFMVRTRADANTFEARNNDTQPREAAFASGAQYISTDYYIPRLEFSDYSVSLPGDSAARINPVRDSQEN